MDAIDWEAFLKGWEGQPTTSPTSSSESELLTSGVESAGPESAFKEPFVELLAESAGPGLIGMEACTKPDRLSYRFGKGKDDFADSPLSPKPGKDQYRK